MDKAKNAAMFAVELYLYLFLARLLCWVVEGASWLAGTWLGLVGLAIIGLAALMMALLVTKNVVAVVLVLIGEVLMYLLVIFSGSIAGACGAGIGYGVFTVVGAVAVMAVGAVLGFTCNAKALMLTELWAQFPKVGRAKVSS